MIRMIFEIDPLTNNVGFDARHQSGAKLTRLEAAYYISKLISSLIKDARDEDNRGRILLAPPNDGQLRVIS